MRDPFDFSGLPVDRKYITADNLCQQSQVICVTLRRTQLTVPSRGRGQVTSRVASRDVPSQVASASFAYPYATTRSQLQRWLARKVAPSTSGGPWCDPSHYGARAMSGACSCLPRSQLWPLCHYGEISVSHKRDSRPGCHGVPHFLTSLPELGSPGGRGRNGPLRGLLLVRSGAWRFGNPGYSVFIIERPRLLRRS